MTAKQLEQETGCKIMVRGKGSMRDKKKVCITDKPLCFVIRLEIYLFISHVYCGKNSALMDSI